MEKQNSAPESPSSRTIDITERDASGQLVAIYTASRSTAGLTKKAVHKVDIEFPRKPKSWTKQFIEVFLPAGYPSSVSEDYLEYQIYDSLQAFSSSIAGLISSRAVLEGVGVGDSTASPTTALLLSVVQDSVGRIGTILFASRLGLSLEPECKTWRFAADIFNDAAMILDCLSPAFPKAARVGLLSASSLLRALCGVAAGSAKASLSAHFATRGNLGELNAKDASQETIISLLGMLTGTVIVPFLTTPFLTWTALLILLSIHLTMNYLAVRAVRLRTLNRQRANIVLEQFLLQHEDQQGTYAFTYFDRINDPGGHPWLTNWRAKVLWELRGKRRGMKGDFVPSPREAAKLEVIIPRKYGVVEFRSFELGKVEFGSMSDLNSLIISDQLFWFRPFNPLDPKELAAKTLLSLIELFAAEDYILFLDIVGRRAVIVVKTRATTRTVLKAWLIAMVCFIAITVKDGRDADDGSNDHLKDDIWKVDKADSYLEITRKSLEYVNKLWPSLSEALEQEGWDLDIGALETSSEKRITITERSDSEEKKKK